MNKGKIGLFVVCALSIGFFSKSLCAQYFLVLPLPYPIDYLDKISGPAQKEIDKDEVVEEAPPTAFRRLTPSDFQSQKALGYVYGKTFSVPKGLKRQVDFWKRIYHTYSIYQYVIHDSKYMMDYRAVGISDIERRRISYRQKRKLMNRRLNAHKAQLRALLRSVHKKQKHPSLMNAKEKKIFDLFKGIKEPNKFLRAANRGRLRSQLGQKQRFRQGIIWAGRYLDRMEEIFREAGLPMELTRLPFVESSFNLRARSKVGASGIWQFIRSTGRRFMRVNRAIDERNDPIAATKAAAKLLKLNYRSLKSWPLALTAYNHGRAGMMRAVRRVGSNDIVDVIIKYKSKTFGFASKNFYASFLAALQVELNYEKYWGEVKAEAPLEYETVKMKDYISIYTLIKRTHLNKRIIRRYNPALTGYVYSGSKFIPKGYMLKIPKGTKRAFKASYKLIPKRFTRRSQKKNIYHKVRRGDTLYYLAKRYRTSVRAIRNANRIGRVLQAGQTIVIPR